jgi:hypothetical protein
MESLPDTTEHSFATMRIKADYVRHTAPMWADLCKHSLLLASASRANPPSVNFNPKGGRDAPIKMNRFHSVARPRFSHCGGLRFFAMAIAAILAPVCCAGCANNELAAARAQLQAGDLVEAHRSLVAASRSSNLSHQESREIDDDLCFTEYRIGPPEYSIARERATCGEATKLSGSRSGPIVTKLDKQEHDAAAAKFASALKAGDLTRADQAIIDYQHYPGADMTAMAEWSRQLHRASVRQFVLSSPRRRSELTPTIVAMERRYPEMRKMNDAAFARWVMQNATVAGEPMVSAISVGHNGIRLNVAERRLPDVRFNLNRFARINDAMIARCRCDGHTAIDVAGSGLPVYLLRLDPQTRQSEVVVMPQSR